MRIGIDVRLKNETGVGRYIRNLIRLLPQLDKKNEYVFLDYPIRWHSIEEHVKLPGLLKKEHLDLVHFPYFNVPLHVPIPFVITMHDLIVNKFATGRASTLPSPLYWMKHAGYQIVSRSAMNRAMAIIVPSHTTKEELLRYYHVPEQKVTVIYEGADEGSFGKPTKHSAAVGKNYILSVTNAYPHKNIERLIEAVRQTPIELVIVGSDNFFFKRLKEKVKKMPNIIFTGYVPDAELAWLYNHAKGVVIPSLDEGFGLPALEAMGMGVPVAVSDIPVFHEICRDTVLYMDPLSVERIRQAVTTLFSSYDKSRIPKAKKRASEFTWEKMAKQTVKIYESCTRL